MTTATSSDREIALADLATIQRFIVDMNHRDVDAAMGEQCVESRITKKERKLFDQQLDRLLDTKGEIGFATILPEFERTIRPLQPGDESRTYEIQFRIKSTEVGTPLYVVLIGQAGRRRLCGWSPLAVVAKDLVVPDSGSTPHVPRDLMPEVTDRSYRSYLDEEQPPLAKDAEVRTWFRSWKHGTYGGASAFATQHRTAHDAAAALERSLANYAPDSVSTFEVPGLPDAVGLKVMAFGWLGIQPPGTGPDLDVVAQRFGDRVVVARVTDQPGQRELVIDLARQMHDLATS